MHTCIIAAYFTPIPALRRPLLTMTTAKVIAETDTSYVVELPSLGTPGKLQCASSTHKAAHQSTYDLLNPRRPVSSYVQVDSEISIMLKPDV